MRIALPVWDGRISPVFDTATTLVLVDYAAGAETARSEHALRASFPLGRAGKLVELGVEVLICGAVSRPLASMIAGYGIQLLPFVSGDVEEVLSAYKSGRLGVPNYPPQFRMPGCRGRRARFGKRWRGRGRPW